MSLGASSFAHHLSCHLPGLSAEVVDDIIGNGCQFDIAICFTEARHIAAPFSCPEIRTGQHHAHKVDALWIIHCLASGERSIAAFASAAVPLMAGRADAFEDSLTVQIPKVGSARLPRLGCEHSGWCRIDFRARFSGLWFDAPGIGNEGGNVLVGQVLQAVRNRLGHGTGGGTAIRRMTARQVVGYLSVAPAADAVALVWSDVVGVPALEHGATELLRECHCEADVA